MSKKYTLKAETMSVAVKVTDSISMELESNYLFYSNREKISSILSKESLDQNDIIDVFIGLHLVLELGINNIFRKLIGPTLKKQVDKHIMVNNLDKINFIDKTVMFIYYSKFNFTDMDKATEYHSIINKLRSFSEMRNLLLHGHSISEISEQGENSQSRLKKNLNSLKLQEQLRDFKFIIDGLGYYLDCMESGWTEQGTADYKEAYLSYSFLPK